MIKQTVDLNKPLRCFRYGRMSDEMQNPKSPEQQFGEIERTMRLQGRSWKILRDYRDDGVKGGYILKRPQFQQMLRDIRTGELKVDAILVDTLERFGRAEEVPTIRHALLSKDGVLVLTADSGFIDPTSVAGKAVGFVEQIRATTGNVVRAHDVLRAKLELARNKRWPGGPIPFGKKLAHHVVTGASGKDSVESIMEDDPETAWIAAKMFELAKTSGRGGGSIAKELNADPTIPEKFKPFTASFVGYVFDNPVYKGVLRFNAKCTGIVNDIRVQQKNAEEEVLYVADFCSPLVRPQDWDAVQAVRRRRSDALKAVRAKGCLDPEEQKQIQTLGAGITLKYPLTGLVYCGECGARMVPCSSTGAVKGGKRYAYYRCPHRTHGGNCRNSVYLHEDKLRAAVLARMRAVLFPKPLESSQARSPDWLEPLMQEIRQALAVLGVQQPDQRQALRHELDDLRGKLAGWMQSLGKRDLPSALREGLERQYEHAAARQRTIEGQLTDLERHAERVEQVLDAKQAIAGLARLEDVLVLGNATDANFELSLHIDRIDVHADGTVIMRTCKLGAFAGAVELLSAIPGSSLAKTTPEQPVRHRVKNRRRGRLRLSDRVAPARSGGGASSKAGPESGATADDELRVADPGRFANLSDQWFWSEYLPIEPKVSWAEAHAAEIHDLRKKDPKRWTLSALAKGFGVSKSTIQNALKKAAGTTLHPTSAGAVQGQAPLAAAQSPAAA